MGRMPARASARKRVEFVVDEESSQIPVGSSRSVNGGLPLPSLKMAPKAGYPADKSCKSRPEIVAAKLALKWPGLRRRSSAILRGRDRHIVGRAIVVGAVVVEERRDGGRALELKVCTQEKLTERIGFVIAVAQADAGILR